MKTDNLARQRLDRVWLTPDSCDLDEFRKQVARQTDLKDYPLASDVALNALVYDGDKVRQEAKDPEGRKALMAEWAETMLTGPGIVVFKKAFADLEPVDQATKIFFAMIAEQHAAGKSAGDHFAKPGANDRIWNALEKLCLREPEVFARYYGNELIAMVSEAWLGTGYQITSQLNVVNPGGQAQSAHRDYHMGFQTADEISAFPAHAHRLSPVMTLQGAVAHCDMPLESGPTLYLPYSQSFLPGYFAYRKPEFQAYFDEHRMQLPLARGDAVFFNPALFHAAGTNRTTDVKRMANLLQVSTAYGRAMESVDRLKMSAALYPALQRLMKSKALDERHARYAVAASAEGYSFPTNLDRDPPLGGLAPPSQQALMLKALQEEWTPKAFQDALDQQAWKKLT
jgi:ectoine hydroxylase-related dioxygenase (phytanoyl-CoA dioxygenase family)